LILCAGWKCLDPNTDLLSGAPIAELLGEHRDLVGITGLDGAD
jgi:hypothetical protein